MLFWLEGWKKSQSIPIWIDGNKTNINIEYSSHLTYKNVSLCEDREPYWFDKPVYINQDYLFLFCFNKSFVTVEQIRKYKPFPELQFSDLHHFRKRHSKKKKKIMKPIWNCNSVFSETRMHIIFMHIFQCLFSCFFFFLIYTLFLFL